MAKISSVQRETYRKVRRVSTQTLNREWPLALFILSCLFNLNCFNPNIKSGVASGPNVHEVEVPDEVAKLSGDELFKKLVEIDEVKKIIKT